MRATFIRTLTELTDEDERIVFLTGDLGFMAVEPFAERHPDRFYNMGVAEQNMVGVATGLAEAGFVPFVYSIVTFATLRPYEFIRNGPILHKLPVRIVGIGGGFEYGSAGPTHHGVEDVGVLRVHPGIGVYAPADAAQTESILRATWDQPGPVYYRLGKDDTTRVPGLDGRFDLREVQRVREGNDLVFLTLGSVAPRAVEAAEALAEHDIAAGVAVVASLNPPPAEDLAALLGSVPLAISVEAHSIVGGLGSLVAEVIAERGLDARLVRAGVRSFPDELGGSERYLLGMHGLSAEALAQTALAAHKELQ